MGQPLTRKKEINMIDLTLPNKCFNYLRLGGEIICKKNSDFDIIKLQIRAESLFTSTAALGLWPKGDKAKRFKIFRSRSVSLKSSCLDDDSGFDKVDF